MSRKKYDRDFDAQFEAFLKDSVSSEESLDSNRINKFLEKPKRDNKPWWMEDDDEGSGVLTGTGKSFMKKKTAKDSGSGKSDKKPDVQPRSRGKKEGKGKTRTDISISRDSLDDISEKSEEDFHHDRPRVHIPNISLDSSGDSSGIHGTRQRVGIDTLDELADKEKFFMDLEKNVDGTIDYGRLNQELSVTANTFSPEVAAKNAATLVALEDIQDEDEEEVHTPERRGAHNLSDRPDGPMSEKEHSEQKPSMLSKVSLMDSLESTMNTTTSPQVGRSTLKDAQDMLDERDEIDLDGPQRSIPETLKTATGFMGTNTSQEIEALHRALREVGLSSATLGNDSQLMDLSAQGERGTAELVQKLLGGEAGRKSKSGKQRNVEEILKELEDLQKKARDEETRSPDSHSPSPRGISRQRPVDEDEPDGDGEEVRGFALSPVPRDYDGGQGFDNSHTEDTELYQPVTQVTKDSLSDYGTSVTERSQGKKKKSDRGKKGERSGRVKDKQEKPKDRPERNSKVRRSRSTSPDKLEKSLKVKYDKVKSSGYGHVSPAKPPRDRGRDHSLEGDYDRDLSGTRQRTLQRNNNKEIFKSPTRSPSRNTDMRKTSPKVGQDTLGRNKKTWSPADTTKLKVKGTLTSKQAIAGIGGAVGDSQVQASIESFTQYIKEHFMKRSAPEIQKSHEEPSVSASFKEKEKSGEDGEDKIMAAHDQARLQADMDAMARGYERKLESQKLEFQQGIAELKQENYVLSVKVSEKESRQAKRKVQDGEEVSKDDVSHLQKEIKEQETLIAGYQQENKRLYNELKNLQKQNKQMEERMFNENQKLLAENSNLRTQLEQKESEIKNKGAITSLAVQQKIAAGNTGTVSAGVVAHFESELSESKRTCDALNREMLILQQQRGELEKHIDKVIKEREELRLKVEEAKVMKSEEAQELEKKYNEEIDKLKKKIKWYTENQDLLEKGTKKVRQRDDEIHRLKMRIEELQTESGKRVEDSKFRARERAGDARKIQDLQRQVKEMEQIMKRRHPNALSTLMIAAAAADSDQSQQNNKSPYVEVLEKRIRKLESELDSKDADSETMLRGVEQKYHSIKLQFEDRIKDLEFQLSLYQGQTDHVHPHTHSVALERELESVRERYKKQVAEQQLEVDKLNAELGKTRKAHEASAKTELQTVKESETELRTLVKSLQVELESRNHDMQVMQKSLERLRKEKQIYLTNGTMDQGKKKSKGRLRRDEEADTITNGNDLDFQSLPVQPSANDREYQPKVFEGTHISDIIKENEELKMKVDQLHLRLDEQRVDLQKALAETEIITRRTREAFEEKIETMRAVHQKDVQKILAQQALDHSTSRLAEFQSKLDTQEVMIRHLREQQARLEVEAEAASVLRIKQTRLEETLKTLNNELKEAKKSHTPEMRHFESLQEKIVQIENKHTQREQELQQIIRNARQTASAEIEKEILKWKKIVDMKNNEISKFRVELDSILEVLRMLQRQGVVIPVGSSVT